MSATEPIPGTSDLWEPEVGDWLCLENTAREIFHRYGYGELRTPVMERTDVFVHNLGETTDVVQKEMYTFEDRGGRSLTLRPEGTAGAIRAIAHHGLEQGEERRIFYIGPMFRGERPAAGRRRQFHQIGVEAVGNSSPWMDAECIAMLMQFLDAAGAGGGKLLLNSRGLPEDRPVVAKALSDYFRPYASSLCEDCQRRLTTNISRVLDCKNPACQEIIAGAPNITDLFCAESKQYFSQVCAALDKLGIAYMVAPRLVRGLDYYVHTVFEVTHSALGGQDAVAGGGRYLITPAGANKPLAGIGFASGMERLLLIRNARGLVAAQDGEADLFITALGEEAVSGGLALAQRLRAGLAGLRVRADFSNRSLKAQMRTANKLGAKRVLILGENELSRGVVVCRDMRDSSQEEVSLEAIVGFLKEKEA